MFSPGGPQTGLEGSRPPSLAGRQPTCCSSPDGSRFLTRNILRPCTAEQHQFIRTIRGQESEIPTTHCRIPPQINRAGRRFPLLHPTTSSAPATKRLPPSSPGIPHKSGNASRQDCASARTFSIGTSGPTPIPGQWRRRFLQALLPRTFSGQKGKARHCSGFTSWIEQPPSSTKRQGPSVGPARRKSPSSISQCRALNSSVLSRK